MDLLSDLVPPATHVTTKPCVYHLLGGQIRLVLPHRPHRLVKHYCEAAVLARLPPANAHVRKSPARDPSGVGS